ncbi:helix-hairpin-helix domain-containing protein [Streptomyces sp. NPDC087422]|uniref:helix-hairpin-helix domain-containing protein n=1 Tax=Streptomyces sp. NPDC087422 TaxID=3365786 RepID=UPI00381095F6
MAAEAATMQAAEAAEVGAGAPAGTDGADGGPEADAEATDDAQSSVEATEGSGDEDGAEEPSGAGTEASETGVTAPDAGADGPASGATGPATGPRPSAGADAPQSGVTGPGAAPQASAGADGPQDGREGHGAAPAASGAGAAAGVEARPRAGAGAASGGGAASAGARVREGGLRKAAVDPAAVAAAKAVLEEGGAPGELAEAAVRALGERAGEALREDPWLVLGLPGVRVEPADTFARALLGARCRPDDERRANALVGWLLERAAEKGHTALRSAELQAELAARAVPDPAAAVASAVADGQVLVFPEHPARPATASEAASEEEDEGEDGAADVPLLIGLDRYALAEESLADGCVRLLRSFEGDHGTDWEKAAAGAPSKSAAELIRAAAGSGLVVHSGGEAAREEPTALVAAARAAGLRAYAAAYTANGRRRLAEALGEDAAVTVEALLAGTQGPGRSGDGALALDLLAVLDAQQLGIEEAASLVEAVPDGARLVFSGDEHAMWSAGPGLAFADMLAAKSCPRVASRTPDPGPIGELVSLIGIGELAPVEAPDKEVVVVPVRDPREAVHRTVQLVADSVPRAIGVPAERTQVITPGHGGAVGTRVLNAALKERLNPGPGRFAGFDPGDRVVHVPVPGRTLPGTVVGAEPDGLRLECEDGPVLVPRADVATTVRHAWAITGHQAAGMRWPAVVVVVPGDAGPLLTRSWVYTAFARGERHLSVVQGADQGLAQAVAGPQAAPRTTRLVTVLRELAAD